MKTKLLMLGLIFLTTSAIALAQDKVSYATMYMENVGLSRLTTSHVVHFVDEDQVITEHEISFPAGASLSKKWELLTIGVNKLLNEKADQGYVLKEMFVHGLTMYIFEKRE